MYCKQKDWVAFNRPFFEWYLEQYPFLKEFSLPLQHKDLIDFYVTDIKKRNLPVQDAVKNCYEVCFSYFLENYPRQNDPTRFKGRTFWELTIQNLPGAIQNSPLGALGNISKGISDFTVFTGELFKKFYIIIIPLLIYLFIKSRG